MKRDTPQGHLSTPPGAWAPARQAARNLFAPVERFLEIEASSGIILIVAAAVALFWANSVWRQSYIDLWHTPLGIRLGGFSFEHDLHFVINDGLMTVFFFVVGLEIRREIHRGELSQFKRAVLPLAAAVGGMLFPAALFYLFNHGHASAQGWGIPIATDIAFAVGVLALLGKRVPPALRILLLALAVIDDVGAILVIAIFYSSGVVASGFFILGGGVIIIIAMQMFGVRNPWFYVLPGIIIWAGAYFAGIHPTLAGVIVGLMTPVRAWLGAKQFLKQADASVAELRHREDDENEHDLMPHLDNINQARKEAVSPVERIQHALHRWVAFGVMPLFALANAGVPFGGISLWGESRLVFFGVALGLVLGKPFGIVGLSWAMVRAGVAKLPSGVSWSQVALVGLVGGIGFTMALFIAQLAFPSGVNLETAKLAILVGSCVAAIAALFFGLALLPSKIASSAAATESAAESSTEA